MDRWVAIQRDHFDLVSLAVENEPVQVMAATVAKETVLGEALTPFEREATNCYGQIVWATLTPGIIDTPSVPQLQRANRRR